MQFTPSGDFTAVNQPVRVLLNFAFQLPLFRVEGMPDWFTTERFDVRAKAPAGLSIEPLAEVRGQLPGRELIRQGASSRPNGTDIAP